MNHNIDNTLGKILSKMDKFEKQNSNFEQFVAKHIK